MFRRAHVTVKHRVRVLTLHNRTLNVFSLAVALVITAMLQQAGDVEPNPGPGDAVDEKLERLYNGIEQRFDGVERKVTGMSTAISNLSARFEDIENRLGVLERESSTAYTKRETMEEKFRKETGPDGEIHERTRC
ncbi:hypothetical protein BaRGS_00013398 [Batillaria attramentaria]|uniref:Uncharacterized protein n=1 Tax=Batillaria attramentaria TaxID=370345 RepID=A0ABD0L8M8_9CAEN